MSVIRRIGSSHDKIPHFLSIISKMTEQKCVCHFLFDRNDMCFFFCLRLYISLLRKGTIYGAASFHMVIFWRGHHTAEFNHIFFMYMRFCDALHWSPFWFLMRHFNVWLENVRSAAFHCNTCWKCTQRWERTNKKKIASIKQVASGNFVRKQNVMDTLASISYQ